MASRKYSKYFFINIRGCWFGIPLILILLCPCQAPHSSSNPSLESRSKILGDSSQRELILVLVDGIQPEVLEERFVEQNLLFVKRITQDRQIFLFTASIADVHKDVFLTRLIEDPQVLQAQWNHKLKKRTNEK